MTEVRAFSSVVRQMPG